MSIAEKFEVIADKVYEAGKKAQYDEFWDEFQNYGNGNYLYRMFAHKTWDDKVYNPKYPIKPESGTKSFSNVFYDSEITDTKVPLHAEGCSMDAAFRLSSIVTIPMLIVDENTLFGNASSGAFSQAAKIRNITFSGTVGTDLYIGASPELTKKSVDSIIGALKTLTSEDEAKILTLHATVKSNMTEAQQNQILAKGWTLA